jgi:hypothetical protein
MLNHGALAKTVSDTSSNTDYFGRFGLLVAVISPVDGVRHSLVLKFTKVANQPAIRLFEFSTTLPAAVLQTGSR